MSVTDMTKKSKSGKKGTYYGKGAWGKASAMKRKNRV